MQKFVCIIKIFCVSGHMKIKEEIQCIYCSSDSLALFYKLEEKRLVHRGRFRWVKRKG